jgi:pSer/pThr/pTyr-binding forkhead associated (FHA) protein
MLVIIVKNAQGELCTQVPFTGGALTIGRDKARNIVIDSKSVSRHHGSLLTSGGKVLYVDEGSSNGSRVDGQPVTAPTQLTAKSVIQIGDHQITFQVVASADAPAAARPAPATPAASVAEPLATQVRTQTFAQPPIAPKPTSVAKPVEASELEVRPMMSVPPSKSLPPSTDIEDFRITLADLPAVSAKPADTARPATVAGLLEQQIQGIRSQRQDHQETTRTRRDQFDQAWRDSLVAVRELKGRVGNDPRILFYVVSRDEQEVTVKLKDNSARGFCNLTLSLRHPIKETSAEGIVWFAETGDEPRAYGDTKEALQDFVRAIASKLA